MNSRSLELSGLGGGGGYAQGGHKRMMETRNELSGPSMSTWHKTPTPIATPSNQRRPNTVPSPFNRVTNPRARQTLVPHGSGIQPPSKRQRIEESPRNNSRITQVSRPLISSHYFEDQNARAVPPSKLPSRPPNVSQGYISVDDDIEQFEDPQHSTSIRSDGADPLNIVEGGDIDEDIHIRLHVKPEGDKHPFRTGLSGRTLPSDGPHTARLREKLYDSAPQEAPEGSSLIDITDEVADRSHSNGLSIVSRDDPQSRRMTLNKQTAFELNNVRRHVAQIEEKEKFIDFNNHSQSGPSKIKAMKGKSVTKQFDIEDNSGKSLLQTLRFNKKPSTSAKSAIPSLVQGRRDPIATSGTPFVWKKGEQDLLLGKWIWHDHVFLPTSDNAGIKYKLRLNKSELQLLKRSPGDNDFGKYKSIQLLELKSHTMMYSSVSTSANELTALISLKHPSGESLTFEFSKDVTTAGYNKFITQLKEQCAFTATEVVLSGAALGAVWETAERHVNSHTRKVSPSQACASPEIEEVLSPATRKSPSPVPGPAESVKTRSRQRKSDTIPARATRQWTTRRRVSSPPEPPENPDELILMYPFSGSGAVNVTNGDKSRLDPGQFLNDTLIELGLKFLMEELGSTRPALLNDVHVFSSFFFKKLQSRNFEEGYKSLRKWTSKIDIFKKKYIIIPINENVHWYLAIIYHPEHILKHPQTPKLPLRQSRRTSHATKLRSDVDDNPVVDIGSPETRPTQNVSASLSAGFSFEAEEGIKSVTQGTRDCSIGEPGDDDKEEAEVFGLVQGGGPRQDDGEIVPDSEASSPLTAPPDQEMEDETDELAGDDPNDVEMTSHAGNRSSSPVFDALEEDARSSSGFARTGSYWRGSNLDGQESTGAPQADEQIEDEIVVHDRPPATAHGDEDDSVYSKRDKSASVSAVPTGRFYSEPQRSSRRPLWPSRTSNHGDDDDGEEEVTLSDRDTPERKEEEEPDIVEDSIQVDQIDLTKGEIDDQTTYIFTLDSLGNRHPNAIKLINQYLKMEAKDKKDIQEARDAKGKLVDVPTQPNYCDCGLYLLHFVKTFLSDPEHLANLIRTPVKRKITSEVRNERWKDSEVKEMRAQFKEEILDKSKKWKELRALKKKEDEERKREAGIGDTTPAEDSDNDIIVGEVITAGNKGSPSSPRRGAGRVQKTMGHATRLRG